MAPTTSNEGISSLVIDFFETAMKQGPLGVVLGVVVALALVVVALGLAVVTIWGLVEIIKCPNTVAVLKLVLRALGLIPETPDEPEPSSKEPEEHCCGRKHAKSRGGKKHAK